MVKLPVGRLQSRGGHKMNEISKSKRLERDHFGGEKRSREERRSVRCRVATLSHEGKGWVLGRHLEGEPGALNSSLSLSPRHVF